MSGRRKKEYMERIERALAILKTISEDVTTPRNIRRTADEAANMLKDESVTFGVRASNAISILDEILQDPNMPPYTRVRIWNVISVLEGIKD